MLRVIIGTHQKIKGKRIVALPSFKGLENEYEKK